MTEPEAIVVGAGPNGLVAAIVLARHGIPVRVYEAGPTVGGGARSAELTLPGFVHDPCSAVHPLGVGSPVLSRLPLDRHGLEWVHPGVPLAHPQRGGSAVVLDRSAITTAAGLGADERAYLRLVRPFLGRWDDLSPEILRPVQDRVPHHPILLARFGMRAVLPAAALARLFSEPGTKALIAGLAGHTVAPLSAPPTGGVALMFALAAHARGWPFPRGGTQALSDALAAHLVDLGGEIVVDHPVASLADLPPARAYLLDTSVEDLIELAGDRMPGHYVRRLRRVPHAPAVFKIDYALSDPVPWTADAARTAGTVHVGASIEEIGAALDAVRRGRPPDRPFLITAQPTLFDPSRAPAGRHTFWCYGHVPFGWTGDLTTAVEDQLERYAPGFTDVVLARSVAGPPQLEAANANDVGGDITGGRMTWARALFRPVLARVPYATPDPSVYLCSAATPPGAGVHGMCGYHAARAVLRRTFGTRVVRAQWEG